ncbi:hypothetical protein A2V49_03335 [candidate division WWE3 bacterium RBG_19FT_COMBO_34_6]|uniref:Protein-L-isoaspartate O-methyltransferase n=1 Tax=candidate division WWE3 bacterium RBG_19FT_COMBO_34_6 TaxID=1802612 RepID=A0A1F4UKJ8_UNCKA|nr:MAG: hypothetical protein A2V49_03335 [candidate division WWE3 bacterium RBG_19FT_COMBO_34_6]
MDKNELILNLQRDGILKTKKIIDAFIKIDRSKFIRPGNFEYTYQDEPLHIGYGQTISQPRTVAFMLEKLQPDIGDKVLDVGSGSGWTTALLASIIGEAGYCLGIEILPDLVKFGVMNLKKFSLPNARIIQAGVDFLGYPLEGPYNKILVSASSLDIPQELSSQLAISGVMIIPVRNSIIKIKRLDANKFTTEEYYGFSFVPLIRPKR